MLTMIQRFLCLVSFFVCVIILTIPNVTYNGQNIQSKSQSVEYMGRTIEPALTDSPVQFECTKYTDLFNKTMRSDLSFLPDVCEFGQTNETQFKRNFKAIFQKKYFKNVSCSAKLSTISPTPMIMTALASYPGSGNTWTRHLIEQLSGIRTTSKYCDKNLNKIFKGECSRRKNYAICVKTHFGAEGPRKQRKKPRYGYERAVVIIRNPYDAILSRFNFMKKGHVFTVDDTAFHGQGWLKHAELQTEVWLRFHTWWLQEFPHDVHVLWYDRLKTGGFFEELYDLTQFLGVSITYGDLWCIWKNQEGAFHRTERVGESTVAKLYPDDLKSNIEKVIKTVDSMVEKKFGTHLPFIDK